MESVGDQPTTKDSVNDNNMEISSSNKEDETFKGGTNDGQHSDQPIKEDCNKETTYDTEHSTNNGESNQDCKTKETVDFKVVFNKKKYDVTFDLDDTVSNLRKHLETLTGVPEAMQKLMFKGKMRDEATLRDHDVKPGTKIMLVGSTVQDLMSIAKPDPKQLKESVQAEAEASKEPLCKQKPHKTVLEKHGKPDDVIPGLKGVKEPLPHAPLSGMYNKSGGKVRLTFKLEQDQLWIGTKERTDKIPMGSIKAVVSEKIEGHEEYHMLAFQLGPTEASRYWVYWVPAQFVDAIKDSVLGKWQFF